MQHEAIGNVYSMEKAVIESGDKKLIEDWRKLQTSDHFYYMCTKWFADGDVHKYFNPYETPYEAFIAYNNVLHDLALRTREVTGKSSLALEEKEAEAKSAKQVKKKVPAKTTGAKKKATPKAPAKKKVVKK